MMEGVVIERYKDRLYCSNPGTMLVSVEAFFEGVHSICRNKYLQNMFIAIGRGEHLDSGADVIKKGWNENGWPDPELSEHFGAYSDRVELTLRIGTKTEPFTEQSGNSSVKCSVKRSVRIAQAMRENPQVTATELAAMIGITERAIWKNIAKMREKGIVRHKGSDSAGEW